MMIKIEDKELIDKFVKEQKELCKKYNIYPMKVINISTGIGEHNYYQLDKITKEEMRGTF